MNVPPGRQNVRGVQDVAARRRPDEASIERGKNGANLMILRQEPVRFGKRVEELSRHVVDRKAGYRQRMLSRVTRHQRLDRFTRRCARMTRLCHCHQHVDALRLAARLSRDMQAMRDEGVFKFEDVVAEREDASVGVGRPQGRSGNQIEFGGLRLDQQREIGPLVRLGGCQPAPGIDRTLEFGQPGVKPCLRHRGGEIADQRRTRAPLGNRAFRRIVRGVEVEIGQIVDHAVGPAGTRHAGLLARHEFERPVGAEMQDRVGLEIFAKIAIEGREGVRRCQTFLEEQAHRIAFVTEGRLHADQHIAELLAQHEDRVTVAQLLARRRTPLRLDFLEPALATHMVVGLDQDMHIGISAVLLGIALEHRLAQRVNTVGHVDGVALRLHADERVVERLEDCQIGGGADIAGIRRKVEQHDRDFALGMFGAAHGDQLGDACRQHDGALRAGGHVLRGIRLGKGAVMVAAVTGHALRARSAAENHRAGRAVELGNRHHDGALDRQQPTVRTTPLIEGLKLGRMGRDIRHIERSQHIFGRLGIVVGRPAYQRET